MQPAVFPRSEFQLHIAKDDDGIPFARVGFLKEGDFVIATRSLASLIKKGERYQVHRKKDRKGTFFLLVDGKEYVLNGHVTHRWSCRSCEPFYRYFVEEEK